MTRAEGPDRHSRAARRYAACRNGSRSQPRHSGLPSGITGQRQRGTWICPSSCPSDIADFRARHNVPTTDRIAVGRTNVPGLENVTLEGAPRGVRHEAVLPPTTPGDIKSPAKHARDQGHAEEDLFNQFIQKVQERGLRSSDLEGKLVIYVSNPKGVCTVCRLGVGQPGYSGRRH